MIYSYYFIGLFSWVFMLLFWYSILFLFNYFFSFSFSEFYRVLFSFTYIVLYLKNMNRIYLFNVKILESPFLIRIFNFVFYLKDCYLLSNGHLNNLYFGFLFFDYFVFLVCLVSFILLL